MIQNLVTVDMLKAALNAQQAKHYPVGAVVICAHDTDPAQIYGGTWSKTAQEGRFIVGGGALILP